MDVVTELSARATAYLGILQDALALLPKELPLHTASDRPKLLTLQLPQPTAGLAGADHAAYSLNAAVFSTPALATKAFALVDSANALPGAAALDKPTRQALFRKQALALLKFVQHHISDTQLQLVLFNAPATLQKPPRPLLNTAWYLVRKGVACLFANQVAEPSGRLRSYLPPEYWRRLLRAVLYATPQNRAGLGNALDYIPMLVYQAGWPAAEARRRKKQEQLVAHFTYQHTHTGSPPPPLAGHARYVKPLPEEWQAWRDYLLLHDDELEAALRTVECAVPFDSVFRRELQEISARRTSFGLPAPAAPDPLQWAAQLKLCGLAFSGGGIRSATFNLGILQGLASAGWLKRFDYLSTVSGGGYVGSWLAAWIKREGSLKKVADRLCPDKAPDPHTEEVRPIRWLRMYSNYLAPNPGLLSADSWTMGLTWLRNTLLNQLIIVLALGAVLALLVALQEGWQHLNWMGQETSWQTHAWVAGITLLLLVPGATLAGTGMRMFHTKKAWRTGVRLQLIVGGAIALALLAAYFASGLLHQRTYYTFGRSFTALLPAGVVGTITLLLVAVRGRYDRCFYKANDYVAHRLAPGRVLLAWLAIFTASLLAAGLGQTALVGVWWVLHALRPALGGPSDLVLVVLPDAVLHQAHGALLAATPALSPGHESLSMLVRHYAAFIVGLPLVLEAVAVTVIVRMALLGHNFPDERREWWGRIGAYIHILALGWLVLTSSTLLAREVANLVAENWLTKVAATGGWLAIVGKAVQLAANARTSAQTDDSAARPWRSAALRLAPYLFGLGLLMLTSGVVYWLLYHFPFLKAVAVTNRGRAALGLAVVLGLAALLLGWRVGVNEFSLHHFYRNRLVRAYLGASRPRFERLRTANPFTSFDRRDDVKLCSLRREQPGGPRPPKGADTVYEGPYLIINCTLNATRVTDLAQQDRLAESFVFTPYYCGFDFTRVRALNPTQPVFDFGYRPTEHYAYGDSYGPGLGTAMAISGAAANPNEGYHSSPAMAFLLTLFNVRLGWWMGNPRSRKNWQDADPSLGLLYLLKDLLGRSDTSADFVNLSDGGHFDNMGLYELIRRRCAYIVLGDGEQDAQFTCEGLANAIRRCRVDFGVEIVIDVTPITNRTDHKSQRHFAVGTIHYPGDPPHKPSGYLLYLKTSLDSTEPTDVREYALKNSAFPHQSTGDQFFDEAQFESYRRLGLHLVEDLGSRCKLFSNPPSDLAGIFQALK